MLRKKRFLKGFTIYDRGGHLSHVRSSWREQTFVLPVRGGFILNLVLTDPVVSKEKTFKEFSLYEST